jgi:hypothetical protein
LGGPEVLPGPEDPGADYSASPPPSQRIYDPTCRWWTRNFVNFLYRTLTEDWGFIQGGGGDETLQMWKRLFRILELTRRAQRDILDLSQRGIAGRIMANKLIWDLCHDWAFNPLNENLSLLCSDGVARACRRIEMPPALDPEGPNERLQWTSEAGWATYQVPEDHLRFSPNAVPRGCWTVVTGPAGEPLAPPECWGPWSWPDDGYQ